MRYIFIVALAGCLAGCVSAEENAQRAAAADMAACTVLGAQPGTDIFIQCMLMQRQIRAQEEANAIAAYRARHMGDRD